MAEKAAKGKAPAKKRRKVSLVGTAPAQPSVRFTPEKRREFLDRYQHGGSVKDTAHEVGISAVTVYNLRREDPEFDREFILAQESNTDALEDKLFQMAVSGNVAALFGTLKARRPERWRDNFTVNSKVEHSFPAAFARAMGISVGGAERVHEPPAH